MHAVNKHAGDMWCGCNGAELFVFSKSLHVEDGIAQRFENCLDVGVG